MKTGLLIILVTVLAIAITSAFLLNYHVEEEIKSQKFRDEQIDIIFKRCDYQKMMDDRNWVDLDVNKGRDHQPLYAWDNSTHRLDNNFCKWQTVEKYESDNNLRDALSRCWIGNSKFLDDDFVLWNNKTHYIDVNTCLIAEATLHSESKVTSSLTIPNTERDVKLDAGYKLYPGVGWVHSDDLENQQSIYMENPDSPGDLILDLDAMIQKSDKLNSKGCPQFCSKKVANNVFSFCGGDGFYSEGYMFTNNSTHYFDHDECRWTDIK